MRAVWMHDPAKAVVRMIDQRYIPWKFKIYESRTLEESVFAIKNFVVRGAPTIGATAAYAVYQAFYESVRSRDVFRTFKEKLDLLKSARPTAHNLFHAIKVLSEHVFRWREEGLKNDDILNNLLGHVEDYVSRGVEKNKKIGIYGEKLIKDGYRILTHCNAGALAGIDIGTATAPIYYAHDNGKKIIVYIDETRPWLQGARLTAWEIGQYGIENYIITDNAAGFLMWRGEIDIVIVGADRIALNGDTANKIGTYKIALAAKDNGIPFYVAAPTSTIDPTIESGEDIPIEERSTQEIHYVIGELESGEINKVRVTPKDAKAKNPVFDVTPARLITGIITEEGIFKPDEIKKLFR
ncbi:MAG: S-methyl-5-thioribose-1-phosphate isomerase [Candidatus Njordarchaeota archaeon]